MTRADVNGVTFIIFISLLHLITATGVYYVTPDDDQSDINNDCPIDHECHTLQYYLLNTSKYFTSNTQLHFLQGKFYINEDIVIDSLHNFSLVGSGVNNTLIECSTPSLIAIINCTNAVIKHITTGSQCGNLVKTYFDISHHMKIYYSTRFINPSLSRATPIKTHTAVYIFNSSSTMVHFVLMKTYGLFVINGLGNTTLTDVALYHGDLEIFYIDYGLTTIQRNSNHILQITKFKFSDNVIPKNITLPKSLLYTIMVEFWQKHHNTKVCIVDSVFQSLKRIELISISFLYCSLGEHLVTIEGCQFLNNSGVSQNNSGMITVMFPWCKDSNIHDAWLNTTNKVQFFDSNFINNTAYHKPATIMKLYLFGSHYKISHFTMSNCLFAMNNNFSVLNTAQLALVDLINELSTKNARIAKLTFQIVNVNNLFCTITLNNSVFIQTGSGEDRTVIYCHNAVLKLNGPLTFKNFKSKTESILSVKVTNVTMHGHIKIFNNNAVSLLLQKEINSVQFKENLLLNISDNKFSKEIFSTYWTKKFIDYFVMLQEPYFTCFIQYISDRGNLDHQFAAEESINFSIIIHKTEAYSLSNLPVTHCKWQANSAFKTTSPLFVNQRFISDFDKWNDIVNVQTKNSLCSCSDNNNVSCTMDMLGPIYPGENAIFSLALTDDKQLQNTTESVPITFETITYSPLQCTVPTSSTQQNVSSHGCSNVSYTLLSPSDIMCELILKQGDATVHGAKASYSNFYVKLLPCPPGFMFIQMRCQCDPVLTVNDYVKDCDINDQTVLRSPNSWIFYSESLHTYQLSKNCPFDYCYPHSSKLKLSNPDSQCQFSRSGILCGQCQQHLSTIFGSSDCKKCSNMYLLLILPFTVSGMLLVIIMFILNLTVSEGTIIPFILYFNILNIHNIPLFPSHSLIKPFYTFISFVNLNLGIETCFYNGMDDYTKTWLQFSFPIYLIIIITSIIIATHHSIVLKRLTLHKTVPVLATILLLSYTKILQTTSNVLFLHSTITDYPSNVSSVVWSIDANVPLFGLSHSILFVFSLLIFSLLILLYTCLLLFGKHLKSFRVAIYINPLLNAYSKAYKNNCCYWIGYELIIRCVLLGTLLPVNNSTISLIIGNSFLSMVQFNFQHPFQNDVNNISQMLLNLNLLILYSTSLMLSEEESIRVVVVNTMVGCGVVQFILMILINRFSFKCCKINVINCVKLFHKKPLAGDIDILLARQDCNYVMNDHNDLQ